MLHFDLMDTLAGRQLYEEAHQKGLLEDAREMVIDILEERFGIIPANMMENIRFFNSHNLLKNLHKQSVKCVDLESFDKILLKNRVITALEERFDGVSGKLLDQIRAMNHQDELDNLLQQAKQCPDIDSFKKILAPKYESETP